MTIREILILIVAALVIAVLLYFSRHNQISQRNYQQERDSLAVLYAITLDSINVLQDNIDSLNVAIESDLDTIKIIESKIIYIETKYDHEKTLSDSLPIDSLYFRLLARLDTLTF